MRTVGVIRVAAEPVEQPGGEQERADDLGGDGALDPGRRLVALGVVRVGADPLLVEIAEAVVVIVCPLTV